TGSRTRSRSRGEMQVTLGARPFAALSKGFIEPLAQLLPRIWLSWRCWPVLLDRLDLELQNLLLEEPQGGMSEYARVLGVARGTAHARLARLEREGVIAGHAPTPTSRRPREGSRAASWATPAS